MSKEKDREALTEIELLRINNVLLMMETLRLRFADAEKTRNEMVQGIKRAHGFDPHAIVKLPEGFVEGEKLAKKE